VTFDRFSTNVISRAFTRWQNCTITDAQRSLYQRSKSDLDT